MSDMYDNYLSSPSPHTKRTHIHTHSQDFPCAADATKLNIQRENCEPVYSFRHVLDFTSNLTALQTELTNAKLSASPDHPEGILDAMLQSALCEVRMCVSLLRYVCVSVFLDQFDLISQLFVQF